MIGADVRPDDVRAFAAFVGWLVVAFVFYSLA